jgi:ABC-type Fe3+ transport system permease subunit
MMPRWAVPLAWILLCLAVGTVLAILLTGCQMPLRTIP